MPKRPTLDQLRAITLFDGLSDAALERVRPHAELLTFPEGKRVLEEGAQNDRMLYILEGRLLIHRAGKPSDLILTECGPGMLLGEFTFLEPGAASASATAREPVSALAIANQVLAELEDAEPRAAAHLYRSLALALKERLVETTTLILAHTGMRDAIDEVDELRRSLGRLLAPRETW